MSYAVGVMGKGFDKKHKVTRIFLADYQLLKSIAQQAGVSMAQALHRLIEHQAQLPLMTRIATQPALRISVPIPLRACTQSALRVYPQPTLRARAQPTTAINGNKAVAIGLKAKGVKYA